MAMCTFTLEGKGLKLDTAADIEPHIKALRDMPRVDEIRMLGNTLGVEACRALQQVLEQKKTLQIANLADIFTSRLLHEIPPALSHLLNSLLTLPHLHTVDLSDNAFGLNTVAPLTAFLSSHVPLRHLTLQNNGLGPRAGSLVGDALATLHAKKLAARSSSPNPHDIADLETLIIGRNRLENGSMVAFAKAFALHTGLKVVKMVQNGIRQEGIAHLLVQGLGKVKGLEVLDLQDNTFTVKGARALAKVVGCWETIRELGVGDCLLGDRGSTLLADALQRGGNGKLEVLRLQYDNITVKGLQALVGAVGRDLLALRRVELNGNKFEDEDQALLDLKEILEKRKEDFAALGNVVMEDEWGIDPLDDLEDVDSDEEDEDEDEEEGEEREEEDREDQLVERREKQEEAMQEPVVQVQDRGVDALAEELARKVEI